MSSSIVQQQITTTNNNTLKSTPTDWIIRAGNARNFVKSSKYKIWGMNTQTDVNAKKFISVVKTGDRLWFVKNQSKGKIIAVVTYKYHNLREVGPLLELTMTNEDLGWGKDEFYNVEIHYEKLYNLSKINLLSQIKSPLTVRKYSEKCEINLPLEYESIIKYSGVSFTM